MVVCFWFGLLDMTLAVGKWKGKDVFMQHISKILPPKQESTSAHDSKIILDDSNENTLPKEMLWPYDESNIFLKSHSKCQDNVNKHHFLCSSQTLIHDYRYYQRSILLDLIHNFRIRLLKDLDQDKQSLKDGKKLASSKVDYYFYMLLNYSSDKKFSAKYISKYANVNFKEPGSQQDLESRAIEAYLKEKRSETPVRVGWRSAAVAIATMFRILIIYTDFGITPEQQHCALEIFNSINVLLAAAEAAPGMHVYTIFEQHMHENICVLPNMKGLPYHKA